MLDPERSHARGRRRKAAKCPICDKPPAAEHAPFCSARCRQVDLHRWFGEEYRIPTEEPADPDAYDPEGYDGGGFGGPNAP